MKVHVSVDEHINPELHELMLNTPIAKRARVLLNLAYKACLIGNAGIAPTEQTLPQPGRGPARRKSKVRDETRQKNEQKVFENSPSMADFHVSEEVARKNGELQKTVYNESSPDSGQHKQAELVTENEAVKVEGAGASEIKDSSVTTSVQPQSADGDGSNNSAPSATRRRRILS